jgi:putative ABC transport system permease protein
MAHIRYAFRSLAKAPFLSLVVILSLGLGIGANTAIFSLLHQILMSTLPVERPEELALVTAPGEFKGGRNSTNDAGDMDHIFSYPMFRELEKQSGAAVSGIAAFRTLGANIAFGNQTVPGVFNVVSGAYFPTLGMKPLLGRVITPEDDRPGGGNPVAVLGYHYWFDKLGGRTEVLNQVIRVNSRPFTIVGVAPKNFHGTVLGTDPDAFVPLSFKPLVTPNWNGTDRWDDYWLYLFARLKPGQTAPQAATALNGTYAGLVEQQAKNQSFRNDTRRQRFAQHRLSLKPGSHGNSSMRDESRTPLVILIVSTALVLLIAMANAANLLLARSAQHRRELAIRAAMGAGRGELMGQLLTEALLLAAAGGLAGLAIGRATLTLMLNQLSGDSPVTFLTARMEWPVLAFGIALSVFTGLLFGIYPSWDAARISLATTLKDESGQASSTRGTARVRKVLVCAQVTVAAVLLIPTGLFLKSLVNLLRVDLGIQTANVVQFSIAPAMNGYKPEQVRALLERVETEVAALPGVRGVAASLVPLIAGNNWGNDVTIEGVKTAGDNNSRFSEIGPGFFGKMGVPLIAGREFTESDNLAAPPVAVVNEQFVKSFLEGRQPVGMRFRIGRDKPVEIVGVAKNSHYSGVKQNPPKVYYTPWRQEPRLNSLSFYVRSALPPAQMIPQIRRALAAIDRDLPPDDLRTLDDQVKLNIQSDRLILQLTAAFAILATVLAMLGLYGVMAHSVTRRTREIGIRMALGAAPGRIRTMVMREMLWILGIGLLAGIPAALALARYAESQLYGVKAYDAVVVACAVAALAATAAAAGFLPARRASRVSPLLALRYE